MGGIVTIDQLRSSRHESSTIRHRSSCLRGNEGRPERFDDIGVGGGHDFALAQAQNARRGSLLAGIDADWPLCYPRLPIIALLRLIYLIGNLPIEQARVILFTSGGRYINDLLVDQGARERVDGRYRSIVEAAFSARADRLVLVHNHPSGNAAPSAQDIATTRYLAKLASGLELTLDDHLIVTSASIFSMRVADLL